MDLHVKGCNSVYYIIAGAKLVSFVGRLVLRLLRLRVAMTGWRCLAMTERKVLPKMVWLGDGFMLEVTLVYSSSGNNLAPCTIATISTASGLTRYTMR